MIDTVAEFLLALRKREAARLADVDIEHGPTIGQMYEGLSKELLGRAIPPQLGLQVVSGFITDGLGCRSGQIDCMLARGVGEAIPYTDHFVWHIMDVLAVFEIKKTLTGKELADAIAHLGLVRELESNYFQSLRGDNETRMDANAVDSGYRAFAETTGVVGSYDNEASLPPGLRNIFHTIMLEPFKTIRVILGYDGFRTEAGFRQALITELGRRMGSAGYGPGSLPQLMISGGYTLCKANGQPFSIPMIDGKWPFYFSSAVNPLHLLLEYLWTRLAREYDIGGMWGDDLRIEVPHPFLFAIPDEQQGRLGWQFEYVELTKTELADLGDFEEWEPQCIPWSRQPSSSCCATANRCESTPTTSAGSLRRPAPIRSSSCETCSTLISSVLSTANCGSSPSSAPSSHTRAGSTPPRTTPTA